MPEFIKASNIFDFSDSGRDAYKVVLLGCWKIKYANKPTKTTAIAATAGIALLTAGWLAILLSSEIAPPVLVMMPVLGVPVVNSFWISFAVVSAIFI